MKSIFITGIAGMLGSNMAFLLRNQYHIYGMDLNHVQIEGVYAEVYSIFETEKIREQLIKNNIDVLIHCAALVNVDECEIFPDYAKKVNYAVTAQLAEICDGLHIKMIYISTDAVFSGDETGLYTEEDVTAPKSVYGKTKCMAEGAVLAYPDNLVARTNIYGFNYREKNSFGEWIVASLLSNIELNLFYDIKFSPILVNELAEILAQCIEDNVCGLYHISSTGSISKYDIAILLQETFGIQGSINKASMEDYNFKAPRTKNMGLCNDKIRRKLNLHISTPEEGVLEFKKLYDNQYAGALKSGARI